jgi:hypothetical protein
MTLGFAEAELVTCKGESHKLWPTSVRFGMLFMDAYLRAWDLR